MQIYAITSYVPVYKVACYIFSYIKVSNFTVLVQYTKIYPLNFFLNAHNAIENLLIKSHESRIYPSMKTLCI